MYSVLRVERLLRRGCNSRSCWMLTRIWVSGLYMSSIMTMLGLRRLLILCVLHHLYEIAFENLFVERFTVVKSRGARRITRVAIC